MTTLDLAALHSAFDQIDGEKERLREFCKAQGLDVTIHLWRGKSQIGAHYLWCEIRSERRVFLDARGNRRSCSIRGIIRDGWPERDIIEARTP